MLDWFKRNHWLRATGGAALSLLALANKAAGAGILSPKETVIVGAVGILVAAFSPAPGTPKPADAAQ